MILVLLGLFFIVTQPAIGMDKHVRIKEAKKTLRKTKSDPAYQQQQWFKKEKQEESRNVKTKKLLSLFRISTSEHAEEETSEERYSSIKEFSIAQLFEAIEAVDIDRAQQLITAVGVNVQEKKTRKTPLHAVVQTMKNVYVPDAESDDKSSFNQLKRFCWFLLDNNAVIAANAEKPWAVVECAENTEVVAMESVYYALIHKKLAQESKPNET